MGVWATWSTEDVLPMAGEWIWAIVKVLSNPGHPESMILYFPVSFRKAEAAYCSFLKDTCIAFTKILQRSTNPAEKKMQCKRSPFSKRPSYFSFHIFSSVLPIQYLVGIQRDYALSVCIFKVFEGFYQVSTSVFFLPFPHWSCCLDIWSSLLLLNPQQVP